MRKITTRNRVRVDKTTARRLYNSGRFHRLHLCPVNLNPESPWGLLYWPGNNEKPFADLVREYETHNCTSAETGRYTAFYVPREWWELVEAVSTEWNPARGEKLLSDLEKWEVTHP